MMWEIDEVGLLGGTKLIGVGNRRAKAREGYGSKQLSEVRYWPVVLGER